MKGEDGENYEEGSFNSVSSIKKILILASGALMNFAVAILLFMTIYMIVGTTPTNTIGGFTDISPAKAAGIAVGDKVISIDGTPVKTWDDITFNIKSGAGQSIEIGIEKSDGSKTAYTVKPTYDDEQNKYIIGILPKYKANLLQSITGAFTTLWEGFIYVVNIAAAISVSLGLFNLFPIPALDGSRIVFVIIEKIKGSPVNKKMEGTIHFVGLMVLFAFAILIAYRDVIRFF
jgi:regulator of sigma E protease